MSGQRYTVRDTGERIGDTEVYAVRQLGRETYVWRQANGVCRCTECSGPLVAMSASCEHARAVKRATKGKQ
jgi:predicted nucleic acid-binding Zn finger protein